MKTFFQRWVKKFRNRLALMRCGNVYTYLFEEQCRRILAGEGLDPNFDNAGLAVISALDQIEKEYEQI